MRQLCARLHQVDEGAIAFISGFLVPLVAKSLAPSQPENPVCQIKAPFAIALSTTPNIRDKVSWDPNHHGWRVSVKRPKRPHTVFADEAGRTLRVDHGLDACRYAEEKSATYVLAVNAWNAIDGSSRHRIPHATVK